MENPLRSVTNWEEFDMAAQDVSKEVLKAHQDTIRKFFLSHTKKEISEGGLKRGLNASVIEDPADILANPQLQARNYWTNLNNVQTDKPLNYPRYFFLSDQTQNFVKASAPVLGEYNTRIYKHEMNLSDNEIKELEKSDVI
jgi:crotonobetainyl-CoA:carnitine CoA-transferase CaiB-like acyl-CoA transferase